MNLIDKLFREYAYGVAVREKNSQRPFRTKYPSIIRWYADPFPVHYNNLDYLFVEIMDYHNVYGQIAVAKIKDGKIGRFKTILSEPFHMSFPNVFQFNNVFYMIPETYQKKQVRLYRCIEFPYKWKFERILYEGVELVDHALFLLGNELIMISCDISDSNNRKAAVFSIDLNDMSIKQIYPDGDICQERAAGTVFEQNGSMYRAIQDCTKCYGDFLKIYRIEEVSKDKIVEKYERTIHAEDVCFSEDRGIEHVHTLNMSESYEAIDFQYKKIYPNKIFLRLWGRVLRKDRRHR